MLEGRRGHARVVVLAIIEEEFDGVRNALAADYEIGTSGAFTATDDHGPGAKPSVPFVVVRSQGRSANPAQSSARKAIEEWHPEVVLLVGVAGGIVRTTVVAGEFVPEMGGPRPGDVIVGEYIHYAEYTKVVASGTKVRYFPVDQPSQYLVQEHGDALRNPGIAVPPWHEHIALQRPDGSQDPPRVFVGEIIHVEGIAGDPGNAHQQWYLQTFDRAIGVDMESIAVARALHDARLGVHYSPGWMCIRTVSDSVLALPPGTPYEDEAAAAEEGPGEPATPANNNDERAMWKPYATASLGAFTRRIVERLLAEDRPPLEADPGAPKFVGWT